MRINKAYYKNFRNIADAQIELSPGVNLFFGGNAQGKTNLLEGMAIFSVGRSFRPAKDTDLIMFDKNEALVSADFFSGGRDQQASIRYSSEERRVMTLNGVRLRSAAELVGRFPSILFAPEHLSLIKSGPGERRRFLDMAISQLYGKYLKRLSAYQKLLKQKNALLKQLQKGEGDRFELGVWNEKIAEVMAYLTGARMDYMRRLETYAARAHGEISGGEERLGLSYALADGSYLELELTENLIMAQLRKAEDAEIRAGTSLSGPHRDDMEITINGRAARMFASQGQQRSCVLALKMGEADLLRDVLGEQPVMLLDDVLSELDGRRQEYIRERISDRQVIITCCDRAATQGLSGKAFAVEAGSVSEI